MGVVYDMHDTKNKLRFELGKGPWASLRVEVNNEANRKVAQTTSEKFIETCVALWKEDGYGDADWTKYITDVAQRLFDFCARSEWNVELIGDYDDIFYDRKYNRIQGETWQLADTRYTKEE